MNISNLFSLLCGLALFMFGMSIMGDALKKAAGAQLERLLAKLTDTPLKGILLGTGVTAVIQSSSATSVMTVGFVNSGMMKFRQSIGIILGALLGTTVTGWIIALSSIEGGESGWLALFSTDTIMGLIAVAGILFRSFSKRHKNVGDIMLGFAVLMTGIDTMSSAMAPLKDSEAFVKILTMFSNPFLGILAGAAFTAVLQSASAAVGILQSMTVTGAIDLATALPILLGISIGAAVPVLLTALAANTEGKRTAFVYLLASVIGVTVCGGTFYIINAIHPLPFMGAKQTYFSIAFVNTLFKLIDVIILMPFIGALEKLTCLIIRDKKTEEKKANQIVLEDRFLPYPSLAISQTRSAIFDLAETSVKSIKLAFEELDEFSEEKFGKISDYEQLADCYENDIGTYLMKLSRRELGKGENADIFKYLRTLTEFERITDHAMSIAYIAQSNMKEGISYSGQGESDLNVIMSAVTEILEMTVSAFMQDNWQSDGRVEALSNVVRRLCSKAETFHVGRMQSGECSPKQGAGFVDLLTNLERIAVHCNKIVLAIIEVHGDTYRIHNISESDEEFEPRTAMITEAYKEYHDKYRLTPSAGQGSAAPTV